MILTCNSCGKSLRVDSAIPASGRMVQCGSCGNKWKQFPVSEVTKSPQKISRPQKIVSKPRPVQQKIQKPKKIKKLHQNKEKSVCTHPNI